MIYSYDDLKIKFSDYAKIKDKICREVQSGKLIPIVRELYESDAATDGKYLASRIYGPSYLSFDFALYVYSLIPEAVYKTYTSATFNKRRTKKYQNHFGIYTYRDVPSKVYSLGVLIHEENGYSYQIATPEKALCDKLYTISPVSNLKELKELLFEDLRIDESDFVKLDMKVLETLSPLYHSTNLYLLAKLIRKFI
ncbi:MAG: hypothetical protein MJ247_01645 [Alphaproteobacteria bacterium]|nr:hypothetical protein [Alphaproteobacteria bacterium]